MPRSVTLTLDGRLLAFVAAALATCALLVGVFPALRAAQVDLVPRMAEGERTGQSLIVEDVLADAGVTDFAKYAAVPVTPDSELFPDIFL